MFKRFGQLRRNDKANIPVTFFTVGITFPLESVTQPDAFISSSPLNRVSRSRYNNIVMSHLLCLLEFLRSRQFVTFQLPTFILKFVVEYILVLDLLLGTTVNSKLVRYRWVVVLVKGLLSHSRFFRRMVLFGQQCSGLRICLELPTCRFMSACFQSVRSAQVVTPP